MLEHYTWKVVYEDGTVVAERDVAGWSEIAEERVTHLRFTADDKGAIGFEVAVPEGALPYFFRRYRQEVNPLTGEEQGTALHAACIGWASGEARTLLFVFADGRVALADGDVE